MPVLNLTLTFLSCILWKIWLWAVITICRKPTCRSGRTILQGEAEGRGLQWEHPVAFLCSHFLAVFHCCPLVFLRISLHAVFRDNDLLPALTSQMRPLRGSCIQEKQKCCGSLAPLFHFLLVFCFVFYECVKRNSRASLVNAPVIRITECSWFGSDVVHWSHTELCVWIFIISKYWLLTFLCLCMYVRMSVQVVACVICYFRAYLTILLCRLLIISCLHCVVCHHSEVDMYTHFPSDIS